MRDIEARFSSFFASLTSRCAICRSDLCRDAMLAFRAVFFFYRSVFFPAVSGSMKKLSGTIRDDLRDRFCSHFHPLTERRSAYNCARDVSIIFLRKWSNIVGLIRIDENSQSRESETGFSISHRDRGGKEEILVWLVKVAISRNLPDKFTISSASRLVPLVSLCVDPVEIGR